MKTNLLIISLIIFSGVVSGQRENHTWYFGNTNKGLFFDYNTNAITVTTVHAPMIASSGYFVACDNITGQLYFYTDGSNVWDNNHQIMPNGSGINNAGHSMQSGLACYYPGHPNQFLLFCNTSDLSSGNVYYSIIDMSLPGNGSVSNPKGNVVSGFKNIYLTNQSCEGMYIIKGTGNYYWLIVPKINTTNISVFKIDNSGVFLNNTYNVGLNAGFSIAVRYSYVSHKIGIGNFHDNGPSFTIDFNETTGTITNAYQIPGISISSSYDCNITDMEWSPNGQFLYLTKYRDCNANSSGKLFQYNVQQPATPPVLIAQVATSGTNASMGLKLGPDGKIYHRYQSSSNNYFGIINNPDLQGMSCNYNPTGFNIGSDMGIMHKFPEFLVPLNCGFTTFNTTQTGDFICKPNAYSHIDIPLTNLINNPCGDSLNYQIINVTFGNAYIIGNYVQYFQPNYYIPEDTVTLVSCNIYGQCDTSLAFIHLNYIGPVAPIITLNNDTLFSSYSANNQWLLNGNPISGATGNFYIPSQTGNYSVEIHEDLCYAESAPFYFEYQSVYEINFSSEINIFPNPVNSVLYIEKIKGGVLQITDIAGKLLIKIENNGIISVANLAKGLYFISLKKEDKYFYQSFVKE